MSDLFVDHTTGRALLGRLSRAGRLAVVSTVLCLNGCAGMLDGLSGSSEPEQAGNKHATGNEIETKHFTPDGAGGFEPTGVLDEYRKTGCPFGVFECPLGVEFYEGKMEEKYLALLKDLVKFDPSVTEGTDFYYSQVAHAPQPEFVPLESMITLSLAQQEDVLPTVLGSVSGERLEAGSPLLWETVMDSLWYLNAQEPGIPLTEKILRVDDKREDFRTKALLLLNAWNSDAAVDYCTKALSTEARNKIKRSCIWYLGQFKATGAVTVMGRYIGEFEQDVVHALGKIDDPAATKLLEDGIKEYVPGNVDRLAYLAALVNQGQEKYWDEFKLAMLGKKPDSDRTDAKILEAAVMESIGITNPAFAARVDETIRAAQQLEFEDFRWEPAFYTNAALAHRGDAAAIDALIAELENPKEQLRDKALGLLGGNYESVNLHFRHRGNGIVPDPRTIAAMKKFYEIEGDEENKAKALRIMANTRSLLAAGGG